MRMQILDSVINHYLALDPEVTGRLSVFNGKVIKLEVSGTGREFFIFPGDHGIRVTTEHNGEVDTVLRGSPVSLFKMGIASDASDLLLKGEVDISGDTRLGYQFKNVLTQMEPDWSMPFADLPGSGLAYHLQQAGIKLGNLGKDTIRSVTSSIAEYLQEESRDVVTATELEWFYEEVDRLRDDVDRLQATIQRIRMKQEC